MAKKLTQALRMRAYMGAAMYQVMALLEWDRMQYSSFMYECGLTFLKEHMNGNENAIDLMSRSEQYWGWWKLHWYRREQEWLDKCQYAYMHQLLSALRHVQGRLQVYRIVHDPVMLARAVFPPGMELEDSYCKDLVPALKNGH